MAIEWTAEKLAALNDKDLKTLHERAVQRNAQQLKLLCETETARRKPPKVTVPNERKAGQYVSEFHFVCPNESEVKMEPSGFIRTGTWVVAEAHAVAATKFGSLIALHVTKAEPSYMQGTIKRWKKQAREPRNAEGELVSNEMGIEFQFEPTNDPLPWKGDGAGEKGYAWLPIPE